MSFEKIKTYIQEARDFYSRNLTDTHLENIEERMCLLITQDVNHHFKVGSWLAKMFYDDVLHPKSRYFVKVKVFVNSEKYKEFINMPRCLLSSSYSHYTLKECYPSSRDCMECWKYWCSFCNVNGHDSFGRIIKFNSVCSGALWYRPLSQKLNLATSATQGSMSPF